jgi:AcrR family transcriptional regulator
MTARAEELIPRKQPKQFRSKVTVEAILDATARVVVKEGYDRTSTNRIARVAGVSIGSLYQYFPSKEALVMALLRRHCEQMLALLSESSEQLADAPLEIAVRTYVRGMLAAHAVEPELHQVLFTQALHLGLEVVEGVQCAAREIVRGALERRRREILPEDLDLAAFVLVSAVEAVTHAAVLKRPEHLSSPALEEELCALILRYLKGGSRPAASA